MTTAPCTRMSFRWKFGKYSTRRLMSIRHQPWRLRMSLESLDVGVETHLTAAKSWNINAWIFQGHVIFVLIFVAWKIHAVKHTRSNGFETSQAQNHTVAAIGIMPAIFLSVETLTSSYLQSCATSQSLSWLSKNYSSVSKKIFYLWRRLKDSPRVRFCFIAAVVFMLFIYIIPSEELVK